MSMKRLRATREVWYDTKTRRAGDEFDAHETDAKLLVGLDKAVYVDSPKPASKPRVLETAAVKAEEPKPAPEAMTTSDTGDIVGQTRRRRQYMRRDMKPEE